MHNTGEALKKGLVINSIICVLVFLLPILGSESMRGESPEVIKLPRPAYTGEVSIEKALLNRRTPEASGPRLLQERSTPSRFIWLPGT